MKKPSINYDPQIDTKKGKQHWIYLKMGTPGIQLLYYRADFTTHERDHLRQVPEPLPVRVLCCQAWIMTDLPPRAAVSSRTRQQG